MNNRSTAIHYWMVAYNYFPTRLESLYEVIIHYRICGDYEKAIDRYNTAMKILDQKHNMDGYLFLHKNIYDYLLFYEYTQLAQYVGIRNINDEMVLIVNNCSDTHTISGLL